MAANTNEFLITEEEKEQLEQKLHYLETEKRSEIAERIRVAREFGDISENSEYDDAKTEQGRNEDEILEITRTLANATIVTAPRRSNSVHIGSSMIIEQNGKQREITIVGAAGSDPRNGKISHEAPLGAALLGHKAGDTISYTGPTGKHFDATIVELIKKD